eukprot:COSAG01_NODE_36571_length_515_cov_16.776442_1_plen_44_part_01
MQHLDLASYLSISISRILYQYYLARLLEVTSLFFNCLVDTCYYL